MHLISKWIYLLFSFQGKLKWREREFLKCQEYLEATNAELTYDNFVNWFQADGKDCPFPINNTRSKSRLMNKISNLTKTKSTISTEKAVAYVPYDVVQHSHMYCNLYFVMTTLFVSSSKGEKICIFTIVFSTCVSIRSFMFNLHKFTKYFTRDHKIILP